jgi:hypothetical protein
VHLGKVGQSTTAPATKGLTAAHFRTENLELFQWGSAATGQDQNQNLNSMNHFSLDTLLDHRGH